MTRRLVFCMTLLAAAGSTAQAAVYKCVQADGRIEYSSAPCGPTEEPTGFSKDATFSTIGKRVGGTRGASTAPPITEYDKRRQRALTGGDGSEK